MNRALLIVDMQRDFCPEGALPAARGNDIVPVINSLQSKFDFIIASKDWHPVQSIHFDKWPLHCIRGTCGADFHPDLQIENIDMLALKGTGNSDDGYSAFEATNFDISHELKKRGIKEVFITGLTTEYCIQATALDAFKNGFCTFVISDAIASVEKNTGDETKALKKMQETGIKLIDAGAI